MVDLAQTVELKSAPAGDLTLVAHKGDRCVLLAMDLPAERTERLAGFALFRQAPGGSRQPLLNRLDFATPITKDTTASQREWHPSDQAPFQKFRWVDVPARVFPGTYQYTAVARYFDGSGNLVDGPSASVDMDISAEQLGPLTVGFTRGYISSQAYLAKAKGDWAFEPDPPTVDYDTTPYAVKYEWLGFHARELIFSFLADCRADPSITLDVFAFDFNEPDVVRALAAMGARVRLYLDDSRTHALDKSKPPDDPSQPRELKARAIVEGAGGAVKTGHFSSLSHDKIFIARRDGVPFRVLTGSANFSVRGLYVQSNNVLVFDSADVAALYGRAFDQAWSDPSSFRKSAVAEAWFDMPAATAAPGLPPGRVAFSPHTDANLSLGPIVDALNGARSSVLFAVMDLSGGGKVLETLRGMADRDGLFSYGMTQATKDIALYKPGSRRGIRVPFSYLSSQVPAPFRKEFDGGFGQVIHHKFVVVDFNTDNAVVYTGSSNLASGGEHDNGDNLLELRGRGFASLYAVEAVKLIDHYHFRAAMKTATNDDPLVLAGPADWQKWVSPYYDPNDLKSLDRAIFAR
jgi:hypothetical protein